MVNLSDKQIRSAVLKAGPSKRNPDHGYWYSTEERVMRALQHLADVEFSSADAVNYHAQHERFRNHARANFDCRSVFAAVRRYFDGRK